MIPFVAHTDIFFMGRTTTKMELLQKSQWNTCHQMVYLASRF